MNMSRRKHLVALLLPAVVACSQGQTSDNSSSETAPSSQAAVPPTSSTAGADLGTIAADACEAALAVDLEGMIYSHYDAQVERGDVFYQLDDESPGCRIELGPEVARANCGTLGPMEVRVSDSHRGSSLVYSEDESERRTVPVNSPAELLDYIEAASAANDRPIANRTDSGLYSKDVAYRVVDDRYVIGIGIPYSSSQPGICDADVGFGFALADAVVTELLSPSSPDHSGAG